MVDLYRRQVINESVDVWALGCFLFKAAFLEGPFDNGEALGILNSTYYVPDSGATRYESNVLETIGTYNTQ
jgi:AP2-associated kinase